ncbi:MAG: sulfatase [Spirochaetota bacterium]
MNFFKILKDIISRLLTAKFYYLPGVIIFFILFLISTFMNFDFTYMGNKNEKVIDLVIGHYIFTVIMQSVKILTLYLLIGTTLNIIFYIAVKEIQRRFKLFKKSEEKYILLYTIILIILYVFFTFSQKLIQNPQPYVENFASHAALFKSYLFLLTDKVNPVIFNILTYLILISALSFIIISINWKIFLNIFNASHFRNSGQIIFLIAALGIFAFLYAEDIILFNHSKDKPNLLVLSSDALRPDHMSFNGYRKNTTPNIDALAKESIQFRKVFTALPRTFPAWVSILTSRYPMTHGINHMFPRTRDRYVKLDTAVDYFNERGYRTAVISDFAGDIFPRIDLGFAKIKAPEMNMPVLIKQTLLEKQTFLLPFISGKLGMIIFPEMRDMSKLSFPEFMTDETISEINSCRGEPFFITTFFSITHFPFSAPYPYYKKYAVPGYDGPYKYFKDRIIRADNSNSSSQDVTSKDKEQVNALYDGCLNNLDNEIGRIVDFLRKKKILDNTIIIITSDHGENLYEKEFGMGHGEHLKGNYSLEIPFIVYYSKLKDKGKTIETASSAIDIMPTVFDVAGLKEKPAYFDGISILKKLKDAGNASASRFPDAYCETGMWFDNDKSSPLFFHHQRIDYPDISGVSEIDFSYKDEVVISQKYQNIVNGAKYRAIYSGRYKLIYIPLATGPRFELYDYKSDPDNERDLSVERNDVLNILKTKFYEFMDEKSAGNFIIKNGLLFPAYADPVF